MVALAKITSIPLLFIQYLPASDSSGNFEFDNRNQNIVKNIVDDAGAMIKRALPGNCLNPDKTWIEIQLCFKTHSCTSKPLAQ